MKNILSIIAGILVAFVTMMLFEFINSRLFPFPEGLDTTDLEAVQTFTQTLPWTAYILVLLGWMVGSFLAGFVAKKISKTDNLVIPTILVVILISFGIANFFLIVHPIWMLIVGILIFISLPFYGFKKAK